jgi:hypothetical protein
LEEIKGSAGDGFVISNPETGALANGNLVFSTAAVVAGEAFNLFIDVRKDSRDYNAGQLTDPVAFNS